MRFITPVALIALLLGATASPVDVKLHAAGLHVTLSQVDNTRIKAIVKNTGAEEVTFVKLNFFQDNSPVKKVSLFRNDNEVDFQGVKYHVFDIASTSDLSEGGSITIRSQGSVPVVTGREITGSLPFDSNELVIEVDGAQAAKVASVAQALARRTQISGCSGTRGTSLQTALRNTVSLANAAASAASQGGTRFNTFFRTTSSSARSTVAARFQAVAREASSTSSGAITYHCSDTYGYCSSNVLAYTLPADNIIANCDIYYSALPAVTSSCYAQDQATTTLHELTHAPGVYSPGTQDYAYGYSAAISLSSSQALNNADSYALFANAVSLGC
ncbi:Deuterolysin metalloprotease family-domain-containing protein [Aspergillus cavernicola]|uniref:Neutral protease 2 n=1 Tax=Aspergillus cavernicola TaxID=176166 RepID=A0ABR4IUM4_9EURO